MDIVKTGRRVKIADIVPSEYEDFLTYCSIADKVFSDEIMPVDYVAYRCQFGRDKGSVAKLRALIETGEMVSVNGDGNDAEVSDGENVALPESECEMTYDALSETEEGENFNRTYAEIFEVDADNYADLNLAENLYAKYGIELSIRSKNALQKVNCFTLKDLLDLKPCTLRKVKNLGVKSVKEIETAISEVSKKDAPKEKNSKKLILDSGRGKIVFSIVNAMVHGEDYSEDDLSEDEKVLVEKAMDAAEILGSEFCIKLLCREEREYTVAIAEMFAEFNRKVSFAKKVKEDAEGATLTWKDEICGKRLQPYGRLFCALWEQGGSEKLKSLFESDVKVKDYAKLAAIAVNSCEDDELSHFAKELDAFQNWMSGAETKDVCGRVFDSRMKKDERVFITLNARANGSTLNEIAERYFLTRERVRQLEGKAISAVQHRLSGEKYDIISLISAFLDGEQVLTKKKIASVVGEQYANLLWYFATRRDRLKNNYLLDNSFAHYNRTLGVIVVSGKDMSAKEDNILWKVIDELPDFIEKTELEAEIGALAEEYEMPKELFEIAAKMRYKQAGSCFYQGELSVPRMCGIVLKERFTNGYKIADENDNRMFMKYSDELFGEKGHMTARAIDAKISEVGVLIDRGKYIHKDYINIDKSVVDKIAAYIEHSSKTAIAYFEIFAALKDDFKGTVITNRYALQGIMKLYNCPYASHKDYISKKDDADVTDELDAFVREEGTVHKSEILAEFPGWKDYNLAMVMPRCPEIITLDNGFFMHSSALVIDDDTKIKIHSYMQSHIRDIPVSARFLQDEFMMLFPEFMIENDIGNHGKLFGILKYMFSDEFYFSRPYISKEYTGGLTNKSVLLKHLEGAESIEINDLIDICNKNGIHFLTVGHLIDLVSPEFVRVNANTLIRFENIEFEEEMFEMVTDILKETIEAQGGYAAAGNIVDFGWYPALNVAWTPFLLESIAAMLEDEINIIKIPSTLFDVPHCIFVGSEYADDDWNSLVVKQLKAEHTKEPFTTKNEILD